MSKSAGRKNDGNGHPDFILKGIGPLTKRSGNRDHADMRVGKYFEAVTLLIPKDGQQGGKLNLVRLCNDALYQAYKLDLPIAGVPGVLSAMAQGKGLYWDSIGEFFQLYGQFEQKLGFTDGYKQGQIEYEMQERLGDDAVQHSRKYVRDGIESLTPLPLYVRNILAHQGTNTVNCLADGDVHTAIRLLKDWLGRQ